MGDQGDSARVTSAQLDEDGYRLHAVFVPWSKSRNAKEKHRSLNWRVTLTYNGKVAASVDYSAGIAHCPSYKVGDNSVYRAEKLAQETEFGYAAMPHGKSIDPDLADVLYSLVSDASVLDANSFEDWASEFGYDPDSRNAEKTYRACLDISLNMRNTLGEAELARLRELFQDY